MEFLTLERDEATAILTMNRGKANALNGDMLGEIREALDELNVNDEVNAIVLASASPKFFSSGFDVGEVFSYDRDAMGEFFGTFMDLYEYMMRYPKPIVAAMPGHAFAGGAILALTCDARIFGEGQYGFALNEVNLGIVLTPGVIRMASAIMGDRVARQLILGGATLSAEDAVACGLADKLVAPDALLDEAKKAAESLGKKPSQAFAAIKGLLADEWGFPDNDAHREFLETFLDHWFSDECVGARQALVNSMKK